MSAPFKYAPPILSNLPLLHQGKTRDSFGTPQLRKNSRALRLIVTSDRISTHNIVHESVIPQKGEVLNFLSIFWFSHILKPAGIRHHMVAWGRKIYDFLPGSRSDYPSNLHHRAMVVESLDMISVEFIYRAYLAGSLWTDYYSKGLPNPYGIQLPEGLRLMTRFGPENGFRGPVFTPTDKSEDDELLNADEVKLAFPKAVKTGFRVFKLGRDHLARCGLEAIDSKFEMGQNPSGDIVIADEFLTPDSSRFTDPCSIREGQNPPWHDKQLVRDVAEGMWNGGGKGPLALPESTVRQVSETYRNLLKQITGATLEEWRARADS